jgi:predicted transcriptional regulator
MNRTVATMMHRDLCVVEMDDSIASVERKLAERRLSWAPVQEGAGAILGVISAADLLQFHVQGRDAGTVRAWQMCTYRPISVSADADLGAVARLMVEKGIHHVVVSEGGGVVGVVSSLDFVREFAARERPDPAKA